MEVVLPHTFECRTYQAPFWSAMNQGKKRGCLVWHRRSGKDKTALNFMICKMFDRVGNYFYLFPTGKQGRKDIWEGIDRDGMRYMDHFPPELVVRSKEDEMFKQLANGSTFQIFGSDNYDAIMGANPVGLIFSEYSLQDPMAWDLIRPILAENEGWAVFLYTPRGENHGYTLYTLAKENPDLWYAEMLTVLDTFRPDGTPVITQEMIENEKKSGMSAALVQQEFYCSFQGNIEGAYYGQELVDARTEHRICHVPHERNTQVFTYWDLGWDDSTTIWFGQYVGPEVRWINYYENHHKDAAHYATYLDDLHADRGYNYGGHYAPHDATATHMSGKSFYSLMLELGYNFHIVERAANVNLGIRQVRARLPMMWWDEVLCKRGLECLRNYIQEYDQKKNKYADRPFHNWAIHGADALRTYAEGMGLKKGGTGMTEADAEVMKNKYGPQTAMQG